MKKSKINLILYIIMFVFAGIVVFVACKQSNQSILAMPLELKFVGEYSQGGGEWQELKEDTELSAFDGDLWLRGRFDMELPEGVCICFYLNHIGMNISINGENAYELSNEINWDVCGTDWQEWILPAMKEGDLIEIKLHNPHNYGNKDAYNELLDSLFMGGESVLKKHYDKEGMPYRSLCIFILVASIALIGTAIGYELLHLPNSTLLLKLGIMSLLMSVYMYLDVKDISLRNNQIVFNTYVKQIAIMLAAWMLEAGVTELLQEKRKKIAQIAVYGLMLADFALMAVSLVGGMGIYDTGIFWAMVQGVVSLLLFILCAIEGKNRGKQEWMLLLCGMILLFSLGLELINAYIGWWQNGSCIKGVFTIAFVFWLIRAVWLVVKNYQISIKAKQMQEELKSSRIVLAMSQIHTHFIFNILNAISGMFAYDAKKADEILVTFSRYLRRNISIMDEDKLESFTKSLEHLEDYIKLEQIRFGERIQFVKKIETENFMMPPLALQPIVENAIRHGLCQKKQGGTIRLHTWLENGNNMIEISDDGVGFDVESPPREGAVGMKNVRFRLQYMVNGTMEIKSRKGEGTTVLITIPCAQKTEKEGKKHESNLCG